MCMVNGNLFIHSFILQIKDIRQMVCEINVPTLTTSHTISSQWTVLNCCFYDLQQATTSRRRSIQQRPVNILDINPYPLSHWAFSVQITILLHVCVVSLIFQGSFCRKTGSRINIQFIKTTTTQITHPLYFILLAPEPPSACVVSWRSSWQFPNKWNAFSSST